MFHLICMWFKATVLSSNIEICAIIVKFRLVRVSEVFIITDIISINVHG